jgi:hypothetical protein
MREAAEIYRFNWWQRFVEVEVPFAAIGLVWNSMMSVAGAWFFLMACEMFVLRNRDFRLPGLGSYLQTAANAGDTRAIVWGVNKNFRRATLIAASTGRFFGFLFICWGVWQVLRGNVANGLWTAFIGWFLESAAGTQIQQQMMQGLLVGHKVSEVMGNSCTHVSGDAPLQQLVDQEILAHGRRCFLVDRGDQVVGLLSVQYTT